MRRIALLAAAALAAGCALSPRTQPTVVAPEPIAADIGARILAEGGNVVDATVAVAFALAVTYPQAGNLGGGGFLLLWLPGGRATFIDYRERAPAAATRDMYLDEHGNVRPDESTRTIRAAGIPGTVAGMALAHERYGRLPWRRLLAPAIELAERGFDVRGTLPESIRGGFVQAELAATLRRIAEGGPRDFYEGETARLVAATCAGWITPDDLRAYRAVGREPLRGQFLGYEILTATPPSSGGVALLQLLGIFRATLPAVERSICSSSRAGTPSRAVLAPLPDQSDFVHRIAEIEKRVFADRAEYIGDPDFVEVPVQRLLDPAYLNRRAREVLPGVRTDPAAVRPGLAEPEHTTHFTIVDRWGGVAANTYTLNDSYGSGIIVAGAGFLLNNEMDDFSAKPGAPNLYGVTGSGANAIAPGKRMLSSMTPTIVLREGRPWLALGTPGGPTIFTTVFQVLLQRIVYGKSLADAVAAPRFHHQWPPTDGDMLSMEPGWPDETRAALTAMGYAIRERRLGDVQAVEILPDGSVIGAADPRGTGAVRRPPFPAIRAAPPR